MIAISRRWGRIAGMPVIRAAIVPFCLSLLLAGACFAAVGLLEGVGRGVLNGRALGLYLAGFAVVAVLLPGLVVAERPWLGRLVAAGAVIDAVALVWLVAVFRTDTSLLQWLWLYLLLAAFGFAVGGLAVVLVRLRLPQALAAGSAMVIAMAWLSWPVWLSPWLQGEAGAVAGQRLTTVHPLLAANGVVRHLGIWTEHATVYGLTTLGQDISYHLPGNIAAAFALHGLLAGVLLLLAYARR